MDYNEDSDESSSDTSVESILQAVKEQFPNSRCERIKTGIRNEQEGPGFDNNYCDSGIFSSPLDRPSSSTKDNLYIHDNIGLVLGVVVCDGIGVNADKRDSIDIITEFEANDLCVSSAHNHHDFSINSTIFSNDPQKISYNELNQSMSNSEADGTGYFQPFCSEVQVTTTENTSQNVPDTAGDPVDINDPYFLNEGNMDIVPDDVNNDPDYIPANGDLGNTETHIIGKV